MHYLGEIEKNVDIFNIPFYRVYKGCPHLDDFYQCVTLEHAKKLSEELKNQNI